MPKVNIFIDGTWLFNACKHGCSLANATEFPDQNFPIDFDKLDKALIEHINAQAGDGKSHELGDKYLSTSIFEIPDDFDDWKETYPESCNTENLGRVQKGSYARKKLVEKAEASGYKSDAVFTPKIKPYIVEKLGRGDYQEKQVDASIVALLVKYAITQPKDYHVVITGDSDMLPAIRVAYPAYTDNVVVATTHPDGMLPSHRQSAYSLVNFDFRVDPVILEDISDKLMEGENVYKCKECSKTFRRKNPIPTSRSVRPTCLPCFDKKR